MPLSVDELLKPRFKVIADYPSSGVRIGDILTDCQKDFEFWENQRDMKKWTFAPANYPAIFKPLEWWEGRDKKDLPEYIRNIADRHVFKVVEFSGDNNQSVEVCELSNIYCHTGDFAPATETEYLAYTNSKK